MIFELELGAMRDVCADGAGVLPILHATGPRPHVLLSAANGVALGLAPGEYLFEVKARTLDGDCALALALITELADGAEHELSLLETAPGCWRCAFTASLSVASIALTFRGAAALIFAGAHVETDAPDEIPRPSLRSGAILMGRAIFNKLPGALRRAFLSSGRRARWLARVRAETPAPAENANAGRFVLGDGESNDRAWRADFDNRQGAARGLRRPEYTEAAPPTRPMGAAQLIAFHLPQFHPIPENDAWWGKGFTEWSNVAKAQPQFLGHYQPRLPGELGFYDLHTPGVLKQQATLGRAYGISAFCFHYYWFAGKRLLEAPLDAFVGDSEIDIGFCLCWANENWTRRWDGDEAQVLIGQRHSRDDHARVFEDFARYMDDARYWRIEGKPLFVVYRPDIIADASDMTALWRELAARRGWPGIYLVAANAFRFDEPERLGFDALVEFPPHGLVADSIAGKLHWLNQHHQGAVFDYGAIAAREARRLRTAPTRGTVFPGVMPGWDNEARRPGAGVIYHGAAPAAYGDWLSAAVDRAARTLPADRRLVFINAWNEWAEGAYLEPDRAFGRAFLAETARVLAMR